MNEGHTFRKCDVPAPSPDEVKRYRAYLTRLSKWAAFDRQNKEGLVKDAHVRGFLISRGELASYLDSAWAKKIFGDKELFTDAGDGFWTVAAMRPEEAPGEPTPWTGLRPGEDLLGDVLVRAHDDVVRCNTSELNLRSRFLDSEKWDPIHRVMLRALESAKAKGLEKPLNELQDRSFRESLLDGDIYVQIVSIWLFNTRLLVDAMTRFLAAVKGDASGVQPYELDFYAPSAVPITKAPDGTLQAVGAAPTYETCLENVKTILLNRGILGGKKR